MAALYRKWRSRSFDDLIGQDHVVRTLRNAVSQGRVAHAYLFTGPRGTGKTSMARILAKAVNCLQPADGNPCNVCEICVAANEGRAMDVIEIDAASNTSVENVRDLRERVAYAAGEARYKVYIVDEVHRLSGAAFDAFLKTLEEPPPHVIFVFASTEPHKVPATITSRCQRFDFRRIAPDAALERLRFVAAEEGMPVDEGALRLIVQQSGGSLRDALGLLDQVAAYATGSLTDAEVRAALGLAGAELVAQLTDHLLDGDLGTGLARFHEFVAAGGDARQITDQLVEYWRSLLLNVTGAQAADYSLDPALAPRLADHAQRLAAAQVLGALQAMTQVDFSSKFDVPAQLTFELAYVGAGLRLTAKASQPAGSVREDAPPPAAVVREAPPPPLPAPRERSLTQPLKEMLRPQRAEPPPESEETPHEEPKEVPAGLSDMESRWPQILAETRARSKSLEALLKAGYLMGAEDGQITVGVQFPFHFGKLSEPGKRRVVEEAVHQALGAAYRVNFVLVTKDEIEAVKGAGAVVDDDGFIEEAAERLREYHANQFRAGG